MFSSEIRPGHFAPDIIDRTLLIYDNLWQFVVSSIRPESVISGQAKYNILPGNMEVRVTRINEGVVLVFFYPLRFPEFRISPFIYFFRWLCGDLISVQASYPEAS